MSAKKKTTASTKKTPAKKKKPEAKKAAPAKKPAAPKKPAKKSAAKKKAPAKRKAQKTNNLTALSPEERYQRIQLEAYFLAEKNGFIGDATAYWTKAEKIIDRQFS